MASDFGNSELRSKFDNRRDNRHSGLKGDKPLDTDEQQAAYEFVDDPRVRANLSTLIENLVIPKLIADRDNPANRLSEQGLAEIVGTNRKRPITNEDIATFTDLTIRAEASSLLDFVDNCLATGNSVESVYVNLLAPAARKLGVFWEEDSEDFVEVTMGLWRIQEVLHELALRVPPHSRSGHGRRSALFSTMPGEQHSLGTLMISECFQRAGWDTDVLMEPTQAELMDMLAQRPFDLIGLTISNDCSQNMLCGLIKSIRSVSSNQQIRVMIGGRFVNENPSLIDECSADGTAIDATTAIDVADKLVPTSTNANTPRA
jgi:methanogenic corrinoid protein MtbC1